MIDHFEEIGQENRNAIFNRLRLRIRKGLRWEGKIIEEVAHQYLIPPDAMFEYGQRIYTELASEFDANHGSPLKKVEAFLSDRYLFRRNSITKRVMFKEVGADIYE